MSIDIDGWRKLLEGGQAEMQAHLEDEFGGYEMEWKQGDEAIWLRRASKGWYPYHHIKCLVAVPGVKRIGIAIHNQATDVWHPHWVAISSLTKPQGGLE